MLVDKTVDIIEDHRLIIVALTFIETVNDDEEGRCKRRLTLSEHAGQFREQREEKIDGARDTMCDVWVIL